MSDWNESTEGDLDPDLTEEAGYSGWDPPARSWLPLTMVVLTLLVVGAIAAGLVLAAT